MFMTSPQKHLNNFKADFEASPSKQSQGEVAIALKENNLWNDKFVKVVNQGVLTETTN